MVTSLAEPGVGGEINRLGRDQRHAGVERRLAQPRLHHRFGFGELGLGVDAAHFILAGFDHDGLQSHVPDDGDGIDQIILALAVGIADPVEDLQRLAAVERHHAGIAQRDLALRWRRVGLFADRHQPVALDQQPAIAGRDRRRGNRARRAPRPFASGARSRAKVSAEISGVSPNTTSRSSAPRAMAVARRQHRMRGAEPLALNESRGIGADAPRPRRRPPGGPARPPRPAPRPRPWARRPAHAPAATGRPPDAAPSAARTACACPRRPRAPPSGWIERSSESLNTSRRRLRRAPS